MPVTVPVVFTDATAGALLTHVPPGVALASTVVAVTHIVVAPVIGVVAVTVTTFVVKIVVQYVTV